jgi:hypothetical protein
VESFSAAGIKEEQPMKQYLIKISLTLVLIFSFVTTMHAAPIRSDGMSLHHQSNNDITATEPDIVLDGMNTLRHHQHERGFSGNMYGRYGHSPYIPNGNDQVQPAPVPEPLSLVLFGMGMIGVGFLARKKQFNGKVEHV